MYESYRHTVIFISALDYLNTVEPSITDTFGEQCFGLYTEAAFVERLFCTQTVHLGPGCLAVI